MLVLVVAISLGACRGDPALLYAPYVSECAALMSVQPGRADSTASRARRSDVQYSFPFADYVVVGPLGARQALVVASAHRWLSLLYRIPLDEPQVTFVISTVETAADSVLGWFNGTTIALLVDRIGANDDLLFVVTVHEMLHQLAFGLTPFTAAVTPEHQYTGAAVADCVGPNTSVHVDDTRAHWADGVAPFSDDVMEPFIHSGARLSRCTAAAVIDVHPGWKLLACTSSEHCEHGECTGSTPHLVGYCSTGGVLAPKPATATSALLAFSIGAGFMIVCILNCHDHHRQLDANTAR
jgi:hypothetical protein